MIARVEARDREPLDREADQDHRGNRDQDGEQQAAGALGEPPRQVRPQHVEGAVREIQYAEDAEHQRQPARHQEQQEAILDAVDDLEHEERKAHFPILQPAPGSSASFIATPTTTSRPPFTCLR